MVEMDLRACAFYGNLVELLLHNLSQGLSEVNNIIPIIE